MHKIALLHTILPVLQNFPNQLRAHLNGLEVEISNTLDEFLAADANINGFTQENLNRLFFIVRAKELEHPNLIAVTCSTLSPGVRLIRPFIKTKIIAIDDAMTEIAVQKGSRMTILATADSTVSPTKESLEQAACAAGKTITTKVIVCPKAYTAVKMLDYKAHDDELVQAAKEIRDTDIIILAQASMARVQTRIQECTGIETLSSPALCMERIRQSL